MTPSLNARLFLAQAGVVLFLRAPMRATKPVQRARGSEVVAAYLGQNTRVIPATVTNLVLERVRVARDGNFWGAQGT